MSLLAFCSRSLILTAGRTAFETAREASIRVDGTASSVAATAGRLGADAQWLSKVPDTPLGRRVVAELHESVWRQTLSGPTQTPAARDSRSSKTPTHPAPNGYCRTAPTPRRDATPGELPRARFERRRGVYTSGNARALCDARRDDRGVARDGRRKRATTSVPRRDCGTPKMPRRPCRPATSRRYPL